MDVPGGVLLLGAGQALTPLKAAVPVDMAGALLLSAEDSGLRLGFIAGPIVAVPLALPQGAGENRLLLALIAAGGVAVPRRLLLSAGEGGLLLRLIAAAGVAVAGGDHIALLVHLIGPLALRADQGPAGLGGVAGAAVCVGLPLREGADQMVVIVITELVVRVERQPRQLRRVTDQLRLSRRRRHGITALIVLMLLQSAGKLIGDGDCRENQRVHRTKHHHTGHTGQNLIADLPAPLGLQIPCHLCDQALFHHCRTLLSVKIFPRSAVCSSLPIEGGGKPPSQMRLIIS